jgi:hypothetical protein
MIFIDPIFLFIFLPITLIAYYFTLRFWGRNQALLLLFAASLIFYVPYGTFSAVLLIVALLVNFTIANVLLRLDDAHPYRRVY